MSKAYIPHHKDIFVVTVFEACDDCLQMTKLSDLAPKQKYVYGQGYARTTHSCPACFDKAVKVLQDKADDLLKERGW
jgi:hypothetical protein